MDIINAVTARLERFIAKAQGDNPDLDAVRQEEGFQQFKEDLAAAILAQAAWTAGQMELLSVEYIARDLGSMTLEQQAALLMFLENNMPTIGSWIDTATVSDWFKKVFSSGAKSVYSTNNLPVEFKLTNQKYLQQLTDDADYLLNKSTLDDTTRKGLIKVIANGRADGMTRKEIADEITSQFEDISAERAALIADTETAYQMNKGQYSALKESGVQTKAWLALGANPCSSICLPNAGDDFIPMDSMFSSGDLFPPGHPRCECSLDYGSVDISLADAWAGE